MEDDASTDSMVRIVGAVRAVRKAVEVALGEGHLRPARGRILVALSGGPDSRVLLDALVALQVRMRLALNVCVVDHGLRAGSAREAESALELAQRLGVRGTSVRVELEEKSSRGAREARYIALARAAVAVGAEAIALGHTASDQAETLLDHLLRGAGSRGLGAMAPRRPFGNMVAAGVDTDSLVLIRPLLEVSRAEIEGYITAEGLAVVRDPTNEDLRFRRSRMRQRVMPLLREERPDLDRALVRVCEHLRLDADYLDAEAGRARAAVTVNKGVAGDSLDLEGLSALHPALVARILRALCEEVGVAGDRVPLDALLRLCRGRHGTSQIDLPGGVVAERRYARLRIGPPDLPAPEPIEVPVQRAGTFELGTLALRVPRGLVGDRPLVFRRPQKGDRVRHGRARKRKLSDLLVDEKIARPDRARLWVLAEAAPADQRSEPPSEQLVRWVALPGAAPPGDLAWEWPSSGLRPRPAPRGRSPKPRTAR